MKISALTILELYGKTLLESVADLEYEDLQDAINDLKRLEHHRDSTVGLWATDRPDLIDENLKSEIFWEIRQ